MQLRGRFGVHTGSEFWWTGLCLLRYLMLPEILSYVTVKQPVQSSRKSLYFSGGQFR